jgi:hypothetical protein
MQQSFMTEQPVPQEHPEAGKGEEKQGAREAIASEGHIYASNCRRRTRTMQKLPMRVWARPQEHPEAGEGDRRCREAVISETGHGPACTGRGLWTITPMWLVKTRLWGSFRFMVFEAE